MYKVLSKKLTKHKVKNIYYGFLLHKSYVTLSWSLLSTGQVLHCCLRGTRNLEAIQAINFCVITAYSSFRYLHVAQVLRCCKATRSTGTASKHSGLHNVLMVIVVSVIQTYVQIPFALFQWLPTSTVAIDSIIIRFRWTYLSLYGNTTRRTAVAKRHNICL